jgi:hypothetical protein
MTNMAVHLRMSGLQVSNEDVDSRKAAGTALATKWGKTKSVNELIARAARIAGALGGDGRATPDLEAEVEAIVQESGASAFLASERPLEVGICAGMAAVELLARPIGADGWQAADVLAAGLWSALGFQPTLGDSKREGLRLQVLEAAQMRGRNSADGARARTTVPELPEIAMVAGEEGKAIATLRKAASTSLTALIRNAALDREEIDFLWWFHSGRSRILKRPLADLEEPVRVVVRALEAAKHLRRLPCDVHRDLVLGATQGTIEMTLPELVAAIGADRDAVGQQFAGSLAVSTPTVFPLINALAAGGAQVPGAEVRRSSTDWGARALLEAGVLHIAVNGVGTL